MQSLLNEIISGSLFAFILVFMRIGLAVMVMPGIGDSFVTPQVRLLFAFAFSLVLTPLLFPVLPKMPVDTGDFIVLLLSEAIIGIFLGSITRILISALDTAGSIISMQAGFSNAMMFNPITATQGSLVGGLYAMLGVTLLLVTNLHHYMLGGVVESYGLIPASTNMPDTQSMSHIITHATTSAFKIGVQIALPFIVVGTLIQMAFGVLGRLMPQVQIFFLAMPVQIGLSLMMLSVILGAGMMFWLGAYKDLTLHYMRFE